MSESIRPAHQCDRCGCDCAQAVRTDDGDAMEVCVRCGFVAGEELTDQDRLIRELWRMADETGNPRPEDILSMGQSMPQTYEIVEPSPMEIQANSDRDARLFVAQLELAKEAESHARFEREAREAMILFECWQAVKDRGNPETAEPVEGKEPGMDEQPGLGAGGEPGPGTGW